MKSTTRPEVPGLEVLVHCFSWCSCGSEIHSANHIKLETFKRLVKPGQAVALSYGIGDFDRQKHLFGHVDGLKSELVRLEFGGEWDIERLTGALVALSGKHGAVWLDQLSIPQDPASITLHLQNMPQVYRDLEVVILLPNAPCSCLEVAFDSWTSEGLHAEEDGDFDIKMVSRECFNAFPVSSYHFRLWTKQEFSHAMKISIHYCGTPGKCLRGTLGGNRREIDTLLQGSGHLSRWASWKFNSGAGMSSDQSEYDKAMRYSTLTAAHDDGLSHLVSDLFAFAMRKGNLDFSAESVRYTGANSASFLLGKRLHRDPYELENVFRPSDLRSEHVATSWKDFALAVLPAADGYRLPQGHAEMTLPELIDDGIEQYQRHDGACFKTKLPRGLFEDGIGSMGPKPSLYLRTENIRYLQDVYGSIWMNWFPKISASGDSWVSLLHLRDAPPRPSRLTLSKTYAEAFGRASTAEVCDLMRQLSDISSDRRSGVLAYRGWAAAIYYGEIPAPVASWPSSAHEQAVFEESLRPDRGPWKPSWPEIDHERMCYNIMCDYVCIHPDVAREKGLGLVVKTSDPPCIGFVNRVVYDKIRATEQYQHLHGSPAPELWRKENGINPQDWLTITLDERALETHVTLEVVRINTQRDSPDHPINNLWPGPKHPVRDFRSRFKMKSMPKYVVRGVWYYCPRDDACIGADLAEEGHIYNAVLI
jgi:hypothetical protein